MKILGIETSCDETGVAVYDKKENIILTEQIFTQASKHAEYGGVVPELASRDHIPKLLPLITMALNEAKLSPKDLDGIAYTSGPGLRGPLLTGAALAHSLGLGWNKPCVGINHMEAHLLVNLLERPPPIFPFLTLLISGGHCLLIKATDIGKYEILGQTRDDAVGEAFDKVAKLLGLNYPGGPEIEKMAKQGNPLSFDLPRPMTKKDNLDFSFSGLKTAVLTLVKKQTKLTSSVKANIAFAFQESITDVLVKKSLKALKQTGYKNIVVSGGVGANKKLREKLKLYSKSENFKTYFPKLEFCTDNGAMIALAGALRAHLSSKNNYKFSVQPRWKLSEIESTF
jgi:N6-L-threonylcarbamoyladenine synthase